MIRFLTLTLTLLTQAFGATPPFAQKIAQEIPALLDDPKALRASLEKRLKTGAEDRQALLLTQLYLALITEDIELAQTTVPLIKELVSEDTLPYAYFLTLQAQSQGSLERDTDVFGPLKKAEQLARRLQDSNLLVHVLGQQSNEAADSFRPQDALQKLQEANEILQKLPEDDWGLLQRQDLASYYNQVGDRHRLALETYEDILKSVQSRPGYRFIKHILHFNIALAHMKSDNDSKALAALNEALIWAKAINDQGSMAMTQQAMAMIHQNQGRLEEALASAHEAQKNFEHLNTPHRRYWNSMVLAELYMTQRNVEAAEGYAADARHWLDQSKYHRDEYPYLEFMANLSSEKSQHKKASELWRELYFKRYESIAENDRRLSQKLNAEFELQKLEHKNTIQEQELKESARQRIYLNIGVLLSLVIIGILIRFRIKDKIIKKQKEHIQGILDSIHEGILHCNAQGIIIPGHSQQLEALLQEGGDLASRSLFDCVITPSSLPEDEKERIRQSLSALLNEEELAWELNAAQLPSRLPYKSKILNISWQPLWDNTRCVKGLQLVIRDDTNEEQLKHEVLKEKSRQDNLQRLWQELVTQNFARATDCVRESRQRLTACRVPGAKADAVAKRQWHTLKGNARSLGLKSLAAEIHLIEDGIRNSEIYPTTPLDSLDQLLSHYESLFSTMLPSGSASQDSILAICDRIFQDIRQRYPELEDRPLRFEFIDSWQNWTPDLLRIMETVFTHALNNAMDHGYIRPEAAGHVARPLDFKVETLREASGLQLRIWDRGAGIQWSKLEAIAKAHGWIFHNKDELAQILWQDEVTTADRISLSSGRGMGLAALRELSTQQGGTIQLSDRSDGHSGTCLQLVLPLSGDRSSTLKCS
jgi:HPt (histidine-containing phosphotransfer) domain-containing protein